LLLVSLMAAYGLSSGGVLAAEQVADLPYSQSLDSAWAHYYLKHYRQGKRTDQRRHETINKALTSLPPGVPDSMSLRRLTCRFSPDFATLVLYDRLRNDPPSRQLRLTYEQILQGGQPTSTTLTGSTTPDSVSNGRSQLDRSSTEFLVIPGFLYRSVAATGANMAAQRRALEKDGWRTHLIRVAENGSVECKARIVASAVRQFKEKRNDVVLISTSKGGAETAMALGTVLRPDETHHVRAWINVCGILHGTPLSDEAAAKPLLARLRLRRHAGTTDLTGALSLTRGRSERRFRRLSLPEHILVVNYIAVPLSCHITQETEVGYRTLRAYGPNDGRGVLTDQIVPGTPIITEFGSDHYFRGNGVHSKAAALVEAVLAYERDTWARTSGLFGHEVHESAPVLLPQAGKHRTTNTDVVDPHIAAGGFD
jgi:hypothetical protein